MHMRLEALVSRISVDMVMSDERACFQSVWRFDYAQQGREWGKQRLGEGEEEVPGLR